MIRVETEDPLDRLTLVLGGPQAIVHADALDHERVAVEFNLAACLSGQLVSRGIDLARVQRACKRAEQSSAGRCDDVVKGRRVGRIVVRRNLVMRGDLGVHAEHNRCILRWQKGVADGTIDAFDSNPRRIGDIVG